MIHNERHYSGMGRCASMFLRFWLLVILVCLGISDGFAQQATKHRIDVWLDQAPNSSTVEMIESLQKATAMWESEIRRSLDRLSARLDRESRVALQDSQSRWLEFRRADDQTVERILSRDGGTIAGPTALALKLQTVRARALALEALLRSSGG
jgi:uncharacterized protein YecT (DUF1311 family)